MAKTLSEIPEILKYGIIGLGALLAILTYFLISKEQNNNRERPKLISTIYIFMIFSLTLIVIGAFTERKGNAEDVKVKGLTNSILDDLSKNHGKDNFFLGTWKGEGRDLVNYGYEDSLVDGYIYDFNFTFSIDTLNRIHMDGTYTGSPKSNNTPSLKPRKISGFCIKDGEYLRLIYDTHPQENDLSRGFGVMLFYFPPSNEDAKGFYCSRSAKTGALVNGIFTLHK
jgi:hypothetical protein